MKISIIKPSPAIMNTAREMGLEIVPFTYGNSLGERFTFPIKNMYLDFPELEYEEIKGTPPKGRSQKQHNQIMSLNKRKRR